MRARSNGANHANRCERNRTPTKPRDFYPLMISPKGEAKSTKFAPTNRLRFGFGGVHPSWTGNFSHEEHRFHKVGVGSFALFDLGVNCLDSIPDFGPLITRIDAKWKPAETTFNAESAKPAKRGFRSIFTLRTPRPRWKPAFYQWSFRGFN